jgi:hypothetical protein
MRSFDSVKLSEKDKIMVWSGIQEYINQAVATQQAQMRDKIMNMPADRWTEHNADGSEVVEEHATVELSDVLNILGDKGE